MSDTYVSREKRCEAQQWTKRDPNYHGASERAEQEAQQIIAWISEHGGEARYEGCPKHDADSDRCKGSPFIAVRMKDGWGYLSPGWYAVMGEEVPHPHPAGCKHGHDAPHVFLTGDYENLDNIHQCDGPKSVLREFLPVDPAAFEAEWEPDTDTYVHQEKQ